ncbi:protein mono-ADP-ribosyltransferase PARP16 [Callorhinchus milii]|uniref:Poly [ADP-ribose] polymerase n=1 Tax=Callorhinchus milii TaxID=7868 RepID=A0A4W3KGU5_CALMI|nr:protein mono-ADP-ribosyltransferase PARP16 [Callorhinchus milii]|eukprot:gi/632938183/ref/XP_007904058.1/ PREDICTED: mono [ADP-ribose] polymerase PARP16 [Callorhinchus milii]
MQQRRRQLGEAVEGNLRRDLVAADLKCSLFVSALQSYRRDSVLRPFPSAYISRDSKDFDALLADAQDLPNLKQLLHSGIVPRDRTLELLSWVCLSKNLSIKSLPKEEYEEIQELTRITASTAAVPDYLFEIIYCDQMNAKFEETKGDQGVIYAFHGSRLENFYSIVHSGLQCHLNKTSLFGEGTYLTSDLSLALLYSPHGNGWHQSLLGPLLSCVAVCEIIDHPDVKCQVKGKDAGGIDRRRARVKNSEGGDVPQKYFVVTNNQLLRVKYLLIYSEKLHRRRATKRPSWISRHRFIVMMMMYLLLLIIIGACNSPAFQFYWNRLLESKR